MKPSALNARAINRRHLLALGASASAWLLSGCGGGGDSAMPGGGGDTFSAVNMVNNLTDAVIAVTYDDLAAQAASLLSAVTTLAAGATDAAMDAAQEQWKATRVPWESSEGFLFGPVSDLGIDPAIDSWPLDTTALQAFLASNPNATQADIDNASDDLRGFHAMEYLLFGDGVSDNDKSAAELTQSEANYLVALAQSFQARVDELASSWTTSYNGGQDYATTLKTPGASNPKYSAYTAVVQELLDGIIGIADEVGNTKMTEPMGPTLADADTSQVESQYSWNSLTDFHNNIQSVMNIYTGKRGFSWITDGQPITALNGLYAFVSFHDTTLAGDVFAQIVDAQQKIALIKGDGDNTTTAITGAAQPFRQQILNEAGRTLVDEAITACNTLMSTLQTQVQPLIAQTTFA